MATISSAANGNWSATGTWTGGVVPGDGDFAIITHQVVINQNIGTVGGGGVKRITVNGLTASLTVDSSAARTIVFGSTGSSAIGNGTSAAPGTDVTCTYYGFHCALGTLNLTGTAANKITITTTASDQYFYIAHRYADTASSSLHGSILIMRYCHCINMGQNTSTFEGLTWGLMRQNATKLQAQLDVQFCEFENPYQILINSLPAAADDNPQLFTLSSNTFTSVRSLHTINVTASNQIKGWIVEDNTELAPAYTAGHTGRFLNISRMPLTLTFNRNALLANATVQKGLFENGSTNSGTLLTFENNLLKNQVRPTNTGAVGIKPGYNGTVTMAKNVIEDTYQPVNVPELASPGTFNVSENYLTIYKEAQLGQGAIIFYGALGTVSNNVLLVNDSAGNSLLLAFFIREPTTVIFDHNTMVGAGTGSGTNFTIGVEFGEGTAPDAASDNKCRSNLVYGCHYGIRASEGANFAADVSPAAGVHHNSIYGNGAGFDYHTFGLVGATSDHDYPGFTNGVDLHPHANYGDLAVDPQFVDVTRRLAGYDTHAGGAGTVANLFTEVAKRNGLRGSFNSAYTVETIRLWLFAGFQPQNELLRAAGHDGEDIGAVALVALASGNGPLRRLSPGTPGGRMTTETSGSLARIGSGQGSPTVVGTPGTATRTTPSTQGSPVTGRQA